jgi:hypothetical protein
MSNRSDLGLATAPAENNLTCSRPSNPPHMQVRAALLERARLRADLVNLLTQSLYYDAKGVLNIDRENEIKKLASKLKEEK